jgi:hypothetical protein
MRVRCECRTIASMCSGLCALHLGERLQLSNGPGGRRRCRPRLALRRRAGLGNIHHAAACISALKEFPAPDSGLHTRERAHTGALPRSMYHRAQTLHTHSTHRDQLAPHGSQSACTTRFTVSVHHSAHSPTHRRTPLQQAGCSRLSGTLQGRRWGSNAAEQSAQAEALRGGRSYMTSCGASATLQCAAGCE